MTEHSISRADVVQAMLNLFPAPAYLEIGVQKGHTFDAVKATRKAAVDPDFKFDFRQEAINNPNSQYFPMTSDAYFAQASGSRFDVIYLDGLHTAEQTLRDTLNAISFLAPNGVIVVDDVRPTSYESSIPDLSLFYKVRKYTGIKDLSWMGNVFKLLYFFDTFLQQYTYRTVSENHGQTVLWRAPRPEVTERTLLEVAVKSFPDLVDDESILRLAPLTKIVNEISASIAKSTS